MAMLQLQVNCPDVKGFIRQCCNFKGIVPMAGVLSMPPSYMKLSGGWELSRLNSFLGEASQTLGDYSYSLFSLTRLKSIIINRFQNEESPKNCL